MDGYRALDTPCSGTDGGLAPAYGVWDPMQTGFPDALRRFYKLPEPADAVERRVRAEGRRSRFCRAAYLGTDIGRQQHRHVQS